MTTRTGAIIGGVSGVAVLALAMYSCVRPAKEHGYYKAERLDKEAGQRMTAKYGPDWREKIAEERRRERAERRRKAQEAP